MWQCLQLGYIPEDRRGFYFEGVGGEKCQSFSRLSVQVIMPPSFQMKKRKEKQKMNYFHTKYIF